MNEAGGWSMIELGMEVTAVISWSRISIHVSWYTFFARWAELDHGLLLVKGGG